LIASLLPVLFGIVKEFVCASTETAAGINFDLVQQWFDFLNLIPLATITIE
jgi:hypothetical protein